MRKVVAIENVTLDGVMQAPGRPEEDPRGGFAHGGWGVPYNDPVRDEYMGRSMADSGALLLGRRTYEQFFGFWPRQTDNPYTEVLNRATKYVASRTLAEPLPWQNSVLLGGDVAAQVADLRAGDGKDLVILGSGELIRSLLPHRLVDAFVLSIHPLVLGSGFKLFGDDDTPAPLRLVDATPTTSGVIIARYEPAPA
jgi:dihydrofolate reductase